MYLIRLPIQLPKLHTYQFIHLPTLLTYLGYFPSYLPTCIPTYQNTQVLKLHTHFSYLFTYIHTFVPYTTT
jgi:hypothetical protein